MVHIKKYHKGVSAGSRTRHRKKGPKTQCIEKLPFFKSVYKVEFNDKNESKRKIDHRESISTLFKKIKTVKLKSYFILKKCQPKKWFDNELIDSYCKLIVLRNNN